MTLAKILSTTPLQENPLLSERYGANISLKREDLQVVRSYKIRGAFNKISPSMMRSSRRVLYVQVQATTLKESPSHAIDSMCMLRFICRPQHLARRLSR